MQEPIKIREYFTDIETTKEHNGYFCSVGEALTIVILGSFVFAQYFVEKGKGWRYN